MSARRPVAAKNSRPLPRVEQLAAGVALGAVALTGCKNPFDANTASRSFPSLADLRAEMPDPAASVASLFATQSIRATSGDVHESYPLLAVAAFHATRFVHTTNIEPPPPAPPTPPPTHTSTFYGGARAMVTPRPLPLARGAIRSVGISRHRGGTGP